MSEDKDKLWLEDEIERELKLSAEEQKIPESLLPENVVARLKAEQKVNQKKKGIRLSRNILRITEMAAAVALVIAIGGVGMKIIPKPKDIANSTAMDAAASDTIGFVDSMKTESLEESNSTTDEAISENEEVQLEGYQIAKSYEQIYKLIEDSQDRYFICEEVENIAIDDLATEDVSGATNSIGAHGSSSMESGTEKPEYSGTNVQQQGVDESDVVKTDGDYIYKVFDESQVKIIDVRNQKMRLVSTIKPELGELDSISDLYVDKDRLYLIGTKTDSELKLQKSNGFMDRIYYNTSYKSTTVLLTYDITNRSNPNQIGTYEQDGNYYTSRKVDNYIYLFSRNYFSYYGLDDVKDVIPFVQKKRVVCEDIYLSDSASSELIMSSVDVNRPQESVDVAVILDEYSTVYMGNHAIYLYKYEYVDGLFSTQITKFSYEAGKLSPVASGLVKGSITDTFAISEKGDTLRVLTTEWNYGEPENTLYLLDNDLKTMGKIEGIAEGESIYAARYIGDMAYFITYRNTDPLFVADLSDETNPILLGNVEVTGFSDYLHIYEDNLVLGIGYETDENSIFLGVKLCMFDVSNPMQPVVKASYVIENTDGSMVEMDYKSVLVDAGKNMIGFITEDYTDGYTFAYRLFGWNGDDFEEILSEPLQDENIYYWSAIKTRGLYANDTFYIVKEDGIKSYDMTNDYKAIDEFLLK